MSAPGRFTGIGVGPGPAGLIPVAAVEALNRADVIFLPRARSSAVSVARLCLAGIPLRPQALREIEFDMETDRDALAANYGRMADAVAAEVDAGRHVVYLTLGDSMTYSTYGYLLSALRARRPDIEACTLPGVTSFAATAAALSWPLGEGKERILILPCPDDTAALRADIESHDIVVLMKIGPRLPAVLALLAEMDIARHCAFARRIGLPGEVLCDDVAQLDADSASGYLATLLIRRQARVERPL
ncbi:precorrin-2 C(20)-methyltransferase [Paludibacterium yongneupense]|uniref:precorrin-2 C(20)-methyltransferase n=1 Tax=Paludibacterium yongneupense TaxID=400061 RepID=UPI0004200199|nr:precorrin-2 C(20)-methyltransferase [Paludibacterium yongneupense]